MAAPSSEGMGVGDQQSRSDHSKEVNPFEHSFSVKPSSNLRENKPDSPGSTSPRPTLPSLASLSSPGYSTWSYGDPSSLRTGPLSPAMLAGPRPDHMQWDPSNFRTGLTPNRTGFTPRTGLTPGSGLTPLVNGQGSYAPPTPNTAAFIAMINQNETSSMSPNTLNAITGTMNNSQPYAPHQPSSLQNTHSVDGNDYLNGASDAANSAANGLFLLSQAHQELTKREEAEARAANGTGRRPRISDASNDPPQPAATRRGGRATTSRTAAAAAEAAPPKRGTKRKSAAEAAPPAPAPKAKRTRANSARSRKNSTPASDMDDDDDDNFPDPNGSMNGAEDEDDEPSHSSNKKPETEEEKRKNFLERNRQAALKCRQRKKAWLSQLQAQVEQLKQENEKLTTALVSSREEISRLSAMVGSAGINAVNGVATVPRAVVASSLPAPSQPISMSVSMKAGSNAAAVVPSTALVRPGSSGTGASAGVPVSTASGYGY